MNFCKQSYQPVMAVFICMQKNKRVIDRLILNVMVEMRGFEPLTSTLPVWHSPAELHPHNGINYSMRLSVMQLIFTESENQKTLGKLFNHFLIMEDGLYMIYKKYIVL